MKSGDKSFLDLQGEAIKAVMNLGLHDCCFNVEVKINVGFESYCRLSISQGEDDVALEVEPAEPVKKVRAKRLT